MTETATGPATIQIQKRDIDGLVLCGEHGGAPYDLLAAAIDVAPARLRGITARWRKAGYAATGQLGLGPAWCWLTAAGMTATGLGYPPGPPRLARIEHARAVLAARLALQAAPDWQQARPWWQSERRIRRKGPFAGRHLPDAEVWWPAVDGGHAGLVWAIETELTAKTAARTAVVMAGLAAAGYDRILYYTAPAARSAVTRAAAALPAAPITIHNLPPAAFTPGA
jgi:hypothetical protein